MATVQEHYHNLLAARYSWMFGDFDARVRENVELFREHGVEPVGSGRAADLGCGSGFQAIALAELGFRVLAVDLSRELLDELERRAGERDVETVRDDLLRFAHHLSGPVEVITCMGDTLTHLESAGAIPPLFRDAHDRLEPGGLLFLSFRDYTTALEGTDRIIPVRSDEDAVMTCFLEYGPEHVTVHDVVWDRSEDGWEMTKSSYRKLRVGAEEVSEELRRAGFEIVFRKEERGFTTLVASKAGRGSALPREAGA